MRPEIDHFAEGPNSDWSAVGHYILSAIREVSSELGGDELAARVILVAQTDEILPNPAALELLEELYPGSAEQVMTRSIEIQERAHANGQ